MKNQTDIVHILRQSTKDIETGEPLMSGVYGHATVEELNQAIDVIYYLRNNISNIAYQSIELSSEKASLQRDDIIKKLRAILKESYNIGDTNVY